MMKEYIEIINEVMTVSEAAKLWGLSEGAIRKAISSNRLKLGIDYRKSGRITLITKEAMIKLYGNFK